MDYNKMVATNKEYSDPNIDKFHAIVWGQKSAVNVNNGQKRWLDNNQIIRFSDPCFHKSNAEFDINGNHNEKIWFSQISNYGVFEDFQTPLLDTIVFKGQSPCSINEKFNSAMSFWNEVQGKTFRVEVIGTGFSLNLYNGMVKSIMSHAIKKNKVLPGSAEKKVFEYILQAVTDNNLDNVKGTLKTKTAYKLIEI